MNKEDFTDGSVSQIIFIAWEKGVNDYWFKTSLMHCTKSELADFIVEAQNKGLFGKGYIHD